MGQDETLGPARPIEKRASHEKINRAFPLLLEQVPSAVYRCAF